MSKGNKLLYVPVFWSMRCLIVLFIPLLYLSLLSLTIVQVGVPIRLLHEAEGHNVSIELKNGNVKGRGIVFIFIMLIYVFPFMLYMYFFFSFSFFLQGEIYRGALNQAEDTMNCYLDNVNY
jgi:small nuclear ribonucleoprotein (snRNP)-like protein